MMGASSPIIPHFHYFIRGFFYFVINVECIHYSTIFAPILISKHKKMSWRINNASIFLMYLSYLIKNVLLFEQIRH